MYCTHLRPGRVGRTAGAERPQQGQQATRLRPGRGGAQQRLRGQDSRPRGQGSHGLEAGCTPCANSHCSKSGTPQPSAYFSPPQPTLTRQPGAHSPSWQRLLVAHAVSVGQLTIHHVTENFSVPAEGNRWGGVNLKCPDNGKVHGPPPLRKKEGYNVPAPPTCGGGRQTLPGASPGHRLPPAARQSCCGCCPSSLQAV